MVLWRLLQWWMVSSNGEWWVTWLVLFHRGVNKECGKRKIYEKTTDLSQVTDKRYHIMLYTSPWPRFELTTSVVKGTDCIVSCKSNYHTITAMTTPNLYMQVKYMFMIYILVDVCGVEKSAESVIFHRSYWLVSKTTF
jgi:hypothetical protein